VTFFTRQDKGRLYVLRIEPVDLPVIHKIGICLTNRTTDRMLEILRGWFNSFREVPRTKMRLNLECSHPREMEKLIHRVLEKSRWKTDYKGTGHTEMFHGVNEERLLHFLRNFDQRKLEDPVDLQDDEYEELWELLCPPR